MKRDPEKEANGISTPAADAPPSDLEGGARALEERQRRWREERRRRERAVESSEGHPSEVEQALSDP